MTLYKAALIVTCCKILIFLTSIFYQSETHFFEFLKNNGFGKLTHTLENLPL